MKRNHLISLLLVIFISVVMFSGCVKPAKVELIEEIDTNETAFLVPLEGSSNEEQGKFMSIDYLEKAKVAAKRVTIPQRAMKIGRFSWNIKWIPTMRVIRLNRTPITREWTEENGSGTSNKDEAIYVESRDSIGFSVGVNITTMAEEINAASFLYYHAGKPLSKVTDDNVRGKVTAILSREFGMRDLAKCKTEKKEIQKILEDEVIAEFKKYGITVSSIGLVGGLTYVDKEIQQSINAAYVAEMLKTQRAQEAEALKIEKQGEAEAQLHENNKNLSIAVTNRKEAEEFAKAYDAIVKQTELEIEKMKAQASLEVAKRLQPGMLPASILPQGSNLLFGLDASNK